jgi:UDP-4-amino-4-deoxy-L-arabinose-oxoglutarate aminotransferase
MRVEFFRHGLGAEELAAVERVLGTLFLTTGPETRLWEGEFAGYLGVSHAVGVSSCSMALLLALKALGVGPGDEVITTPLSYVATTNAILHAGARPVFVDVESETGNMDVSLVPHAITERTRVILPVHLYGLMCDMRALRRLARREKLLIIEDSAHCVEGRRDGLAPGQASHAACFSFYATKNLSCAEGGMVTARRASTAACLRRLRNHGVDRDASSRHGQAVLHWDQMDLGFKANLPDLLAAMLRPQLRCIEERCGRRQEIAQTYDAAFRGVMDLAVTAVPRGAFSARHLYTVQVPPGIRDAMLVRLREAGVGCAVNYRPIHRLRYMRKELGYRLGAFPVAERIGASTISLPMYPDLQRSEQDYVIDQVLRLMRTLGG